MSEMDPRAALAAHLAKQLAPRPYTFPGTEIPIAVRLLPEGEVDYAKIEAQRYCIAQKADLSIDPEFFDREVQRQIVWRSVLEPVADKDGKNPPLYRSDKDVRALDTVTVEALFRLYLEHQERCSTTRQLDQQQIDLLAASVRSDPKAAALEFSRYEHETLVRLLVSLTLRPPTE